MLNRRTNSLCLLFSLLYRTTAACCCTERKCGVDERSHQKPWETIEFELRWQLGKHSVALQCSSWPSRYAVALYLYTGLTENLSETLDILLDNGADPNVQNNAGETPLHKAVAKNSLPSIESLIQNGANPKVENKSKQTPLRMAKAKEAKALLGKYKNLLPGMLSLPCSQRVNWFINFV